MTISRDKTSINMSLDESFHTFKEVSGPLKILNTVGDVFLGGGGLVDVATLTGGRAIYSFTGCVHSLVISETRVDLQREHLTSGNIINCQDDEDEDYSNYYYNLLLSDDDADNFNEDLYLERLQRQQG